MTGDDGWWFDSPPARGGRWSAVYCVSVGTPGSLTAGVVRRVGRRLPFAAILVCSGGAAAVAKDISAVGRPGAGVYRGAEPVGAVGSSAGRAARRPGDAQVLDARLVSPASRGGGGDLPESA